MWFFFFLRSFVVLYFYFGFDLGSGQPNRFNAYSATNRNNKLNEKKASRPAHIHLKCWYWRADNEWLKTLQLMLIKMPVKSHSVIRLKYILDKMHTQCQFVLNGRRPCHRTPEKTKNETAMKKRYVCCARETIKLKQRKRRRSGEKKVQFTFLLFLVIVCFLRAVCAFYCLVFWLCHAYTYLLHLDTFKVVL